MLFGELVALIHSMKITKVSFVFDNFTEKLTRETFMLDSFGQSNKDLAVLNFLGFISNTI